MKIKEIYDKCGGDARAIMTSLRNADNLNDFIQETNYLPKFAPMTLSLLIFIGLEFLSKSIFCNKIKRKQKSVS